MTSTYTAYVTGNFSANTNSLAIEITAGSSQVVKIKKIRITDEDGTATTVNDYYRNIILVRESAAGTGGSTFTPVDLNDNTPASSSTVKVGPMTPGTTSTTIDDLSIHSGTDFYWAAADEDDKIVVAPGAIFGIIVNPAQ